MKHRFNLLVLFQLLLTADLRASEIALFGFNPQGVEPLPIVTPVYITEGSVLNRAYIPAERQLIDGNFVDNPNLPRNHPEKVAGVLFQIYPRAHVSGISPQNLKLGGVFNYSYGHNYEIRDHVDGKVVTSGYNEVQNERIKKAGYNAFDTNWPKDLKRTQLHIKSAGNDFAELISPEHYDKELFNAEGYQKYITTLINKFGCMMIICSQMDEKGNGLSTESGRPIVDWHKPYYICCPKPIDTEGDKKFLSGTSFAAPMVSGAASLLTLHFPSLSLQEIRNILLISASRFHLKWRHEERKFEIVTLFEKRFGNGLLCVENAYSLAQAVVNRKTGQRIYDWDILEDISGTLPKQVTIYPDLSPKKEVTTYRQWLQSVFTSLSAQEVANIQHLISSLKINDQRKYEKVSGLLTNFFNALISQEWDYAYLSSALYELIKSPHIRIRPELSRLYDIHEEIIFGHAVEGIRYELLCRIFLTDSDLTSARTYEVLDALKLSVDEDNLFESHGEYKKFYNSVFTSFPRILHLPSRFTYTSRKPAKKKAHVDTSSDTILSSGEEHHPNL